MLDVITAIRVEEGYRAAVHSIGADEAMAHRLMLREQRDSTDLGQILKLMAMAVVQGRNER